MSRTKEEYEGSMTMEGTDGERIQARVYQTYREFKSTSEPATWSKGSKRLETPDGDHLNPCADGSFKALHSGKVYRPVDD